MIDDGEAIKWLRKLYELTKHDIRIEVLTGEIPGKNSLGIARTWESEGLVVVRPGDGHPEDLSGYRVRLRVEGIDHIEKLDGLSATVADRNQWLMRLWHLTRNRPPEREFHVTGLPFGGEDPVAVAHYWAAKGYVEVQRNSDNPSDYAATITKSGDDYCAALDRAGK